jgi:hypothetical protein
LLPTPLNDIEVIAEVDDHKLAKNLRYEVDALFSEHESEEKDLYVEPA